MNKQLPNKMRTTEMIRRGSLSIIMQLGNSYEQQMSLSTLDVSAIYNSRSLNYWQQMAADG
jgi:hypothetical protein